MSWWTIFKVFIKIHMFYLNSKVYMLMKNNVIWQTLLINICQLSPLEANHADAEITTIHIPLLCCCATSFYSICFSIIKYCGYWNSQTLDRITDHANKFYKENSMAVTIHWLSTISQGHFKYMMQILILPLIWRNKECYAVHLLVANYCFGS